MRTSQCSINLNTKNPLKMRFRLRTMFRLAFIALSFTGFRSFAQVTADFSSNRPSGCSPLIIQFTDLSTGPVTSWSWNFGNGNVSTQRNPGAIYLTPGCYTVRLIVSDGSVTDTMTKPCFITVFQNPSPDIIADTTQGCAPVTVNFTDNSASGSAPINTWIWDFGDGNTSTLQNPAHTFINSGSFSITISLIDTNNCVANQTYSNLIQVGTVPVAGFGADVNSACFPPLTVNFADSSVYSSSLAYQWNFGDGDTSSTQNPSHTFTALGNYNVKLRVSSPEGCADSLTVNNFVAIEDLVADFASSVTRSCVGDTVQFTDVSTSNPSSWMWDFGDGTTDSVKNPVHAYTAPGWHPVTLIAANSGSCADTIQKTNYILVDPSPAAAATADVTQSCSAPLTVNFSDFSMGAVSWLWNFGDGNTSAVQNPAHTYVTEDSFTVTLTVMNVVGCEGVLTLADFVKISPPQVMFDGQGRYGCAPRDVEFGDSSLSVNPIVSWLWDFGDSTTSAMQHPTHTYNISGDYDVSLTITDSAGCMATLVDSNFVGAGDTPVVAFSANPLMVCNYEPVFFTNNTINSTSWNWEFGDGGLSDQFEPSYTYSDTGWFTVTLIARDYGCPDTLEIEDYIYVSPPDAAFSESFNCTNPDSVVFVDASLAPDTWFWDFGDGATDSVSNPAHVYPGRGSYHVTLTCTNLFSGCVDVEEHDITVTDPLADFIGAPTFGCRPLNVSFTDNSIDAVSWYWETGGMTSTSQNPSFTYTIPGTYDVMLVITDLHGCNDTLVRPAYVTVTGPTSDFTSNPTTGCAPLNVSFSDLSTVFSAPIVTWNWNFGDGNSSALQNPNYTYNATGFYTVSLTVTDADGCAHTAAKANFIQPTFPLPDFSSDTLTCTTRGIQFANLTTGVGMTFLWDFGDSSTSTATNPLYFYASEGTYSVSLSVTDVNGCDTTLVKPNYIRVADPKADFGADNTFAPCPPLLVNFADSSDDAISWQWNFGDGASSTLQHPSHLYVAPGMYDVTLIVSSALGCSDTLFRDDYIVVNGPNGTFAFNPDSGCIGQQVDFAAVTYNTTFRTWDFGDGTVQAGGDTISHLYVTTGIYHPIIILDDGLGCIFAVSAPDSIVIGSIVPDFSASFTEPCLNEPVLFTNATSVFPASVSRLWDFGDGTTSALPNPLHAYDTSGRFDVTLIEHNGICYDTVVKPQYIYVTPYPQADFTMSAAKGCINSGITFTDATAIDTLITSWAWNFGDGSVDSIPNPTHLFDSLGTFSIELIVESAKGCTDTAGKTFTVHPLPVAAAGPDTTECEGVGVRLNGSGGAAYSWSPAAGLDDPAIANPVATPSDTTVYILTVTDTNNCLNVDSMAFTVLPRPAASSVADIEICEGDSVQIWAAGGDSYSWSPAANLDCDTCSSTTVFPGITTLYNVRVTNLLQCHDYDSVLVTVNAKPLGITTPATGICIGESVQLESQGGTNHAWSPAADLSCGTCSNPVASPDTTTTFALQIVNQYNCAINDSVTITVHPLPAIVIQAADVCVGDTTQILSSGGALYNWTPSVGLSCSTCPNPFAFPDSSTTYYLTVISSFMCENNDSVTIQVLPTPTVQTIQDVIICEGDEVPLSTSYTGTDSINWSPVQGIKGDIPSPIAKPDVTTHYTVTAFNLAGCSASDDVTVTVIDKVDADINEVAEICTGESLQLNGVIIEQGHLGTSVSWSPSTGLSSTTSLTPTAQPQTTTTYTMIASSGSCSPDTSTVTVTVNPLPDIDLGPNRTVLENEEITLTPSSASNITEYQWDFNSVLSCLDCETPTALVSSAETFYLTVTDDKRCVNRDTVRVSAIGFCEDNIFVPKAFSPNDDEINDRLYVRGLHIAELKYFRVFDRWGNQVFSTANQSDGWDGVYRGRKMNPAVFVYGLEAVCTNGKKVKIKGNVTLIR